MKALTFSLLPKHSAKPSAKAKQGNDALFNAPVLLLIANSNQSTHLLFVHERLLGHVDRRRLVCVYILAEIAGLNCLVIIFPSSKSY